MLSDPLQMKVATAITSTGSFYDFNLVSINRDFNEYRSTSDAGDLRTTVTIRVGNYPNGSADNRRVVVSQKRDYAIISTGEDLPSDQITVSFSYDEDTVDASSLESSFRKLAYFIANTEGTGVMTRLVNGEK